MLPRDAVLSVGFPTSLTTMEAACLPRDAAGCLSDQRPSGPGTLPLALRISHGLPRMFSMRCDDSKFVVFCFPKPENHVVLGSPGSTDDCNQDGAHD